RLAGHPDVFDELVLQLQRDARGSRLRFAVPAFPYGTKAGRDRPMGHPCDGGSRRVGGAPGRSLGHHLVLPSKHVGLSLRTHGSGNIRRSALEARDHEGRRGGSVGGVWNGSRLLSRSSFELVPTGSFKSLHAFFPPPFLAGVDGFRAGDGWRQPRDFRSWCRYSYGLRLLANSP